MNKNKTYQSTLHLSVESESHLLWLCISMLHDWLKKVTLFSQPIRSKTKTNRDSLAHIFPRFASATCVYFEFWLVHWIVDSVIGQGKNFGFSFTTRTTALISNHIWSKSQQTNQKSVAATKRGKTYNQCQARESRRVSQVTDRLTIQQALSDWLKNVTQSRYKTNTQVGILLNPTSLRIAWLQKADQSHYYNILYLQKYR